MIHSAPQHVLTVVAFDYTSLPASKRRHVEEQADSIRGLLGKTATSVIQVGLRLNLVRSALGRAHFQAWLRAEFCWSQSVASNYMRAAAAFGSVECLKQFQPGALYVLARKRVPEAARRAAIERARAGEFISKSKAEEIASAHPLFAIPRRDLQTARVRDLVRGLAKELQRLPREKLREVIADLEDFLSQLQRGAVRERAPIPLQPASLRSPRRHAR